MLCYARDSLARSAGSVDFRVLQATDSVVLVWIGLTILGIVLGTGLS